MSEQIPAEAVEAAARARAEAHLAAMTDLSPDKAWDRGYMRGFVHGYEMRADEVSAQAARVVPGVEDDLADLESMVDDIADDLPECAMQDDTTNIDFIGRFVRTWAPVAEALDAARAVDGYNDDAPITMRWDREQQTLVLSAAPTVAEVREQVALDLLAVDPVEWALAGQHAGQDAARIARGETKEDE